MKNLVPKKIEGLRPYKSEVEDGIKLSANESCFSLPEHIANKALERVKNVLLNRYPDGTSEQLCAAYADFCNVSRDFVTPGNGSDELISLIVNSLTEEGDKVALLNPDFSMYSIYCQSAGCEVVCLNKGEDDEITADAIIEFAKKHQPKMLMFSNPCNPTGKALCREDMLKIITSLDCIVVADEAYIDFFGTQQSVLPQSLEHENCIVLRTLSKAVGLAALRVGFAISGELLTTALQAARSPYNVNSLTQSVALTVLEHKDYLQETTSKLIASKNSLFEKLSQYDSTDFKITDTVTNFILIKSPHASDYYKFAKEKNVFVRYLKPNVVRITAGTHEENKAVTDLTGKFIERLVT